jgi:glyoxalase family protein
VLFDGPDGDRFALIEKDDDRAPWTGNGIGADMGIRGFHSADMRLRDSGASSELLTFMGYEKLETEGNVTRFAVPGGNEANIIDIETLPEVGHAGQGAGSVHHIAFAVENRARQLEVREALIDTGWQVTPVIDRDYFWAIYFRTPGGVLFEVATNEPGFDRDEDTAHLGEALKLPSQHEHLRARLEKLLEPIEG